MPGPYSAYARQIYLNATAVGIDLGTTFSVVGVNKNGKVIIIEDKEGHKIFPSIVSYLNNGGMLTLLAHRFIFVLSST